VIYRVFCTALLLVFAVSIKANSPLIEWDAIHQPIKANAGMVATQEYRASEIGARVLAQGGNAIDAAVAIGFAEAVTLPKAGNLGGGGFMLIYLAESKKVVAIDYRETAPLASSKDMFVNLLGKVSKEKSRYSTLSTGVPGTVAGLLHALEHYGTWKREQVIAPAFRLAKEGIEMDNPFLDSINARKDKLLEDPEAAKIFFKANGESYQPGERLTFPDLAWSLEQIMKHGKVAFYEGAIAQRLVDYMKQQGGLISLDDLKQYQVIERTPVEGTYRGYRVVSMPPPSSGGVHIVQMLNVLEQFDLSSMGWGSANHIHLLTEVFKRGYADRSKHLGDPDFYKVPVAQLLDKNYAKRLATEINLNTATPSEKILPTEFNDLESTQTTHFSVIDRWGNIVSNTYTLNFSFGSGKIAPGTGFFLNNEMDDFSAKPGVPNAYGLIGGVANSIEPKKRPLSSMSPTLVFKGEQPVLITGSPGGSRIITSVLHQIVNLIDFNMNVAEAAHLPRFHHQWYPDQLFMERGFSPDTIKILEKRGHQIKQSRASGSVQSISYDDGWFFGASDPRRTGAQTIGVMNNGALIYH
jgi:gamma-glutamyltranspeptidase/glutathione hydrolase